MRYPDIEQVNAFWRFMCVKYRVEHETDVPLIEEAVNLILPEKATFIFKSLTSLLQEMAIAAPFSAFVLGDRIYTIDLDSLTAFQSLSLCCHEFTHVIQQRRDGMLNWYTQYTIEPNARAIYELEANATTVDLYKLFNYEYSLDKIDRTTDRLCRKYFLKDQKEIIRDSLTRSNYEDGYSRTVQDWISFCK